MVQKKSLKFYRFLAVGRCSSSRRGRSAGSSVVVLRLGSSVRPCTRLQALRGRPEIGVYRWARDVPGGCRSRAVVWGLDVIGLVNSNAGSGSRTGWRQHRAHAALKK